VHGQLGVGDRLSRLSPTRIPAFHLQPTTASTTSAAAATSAAASASPFASSVEEEEEEPTPFPLTLAPLQTARAVRVSCGALHTAVIVDSGLLYTFGHGAHGALGIGKSSSTKQGAAADSVVWDDQLTPRLVLCMVQRPLSAAEALASAASASGSATSAQPTTRPVLATITQVSCGRHHTLALEGRRSALKGYLFPLLAPAPRTGSAAGGGASALRPIVTPKPGTLPFVCARVCVCVCVTLNLVCDVHSGRSRLSRFSVGLLLRHNARCK
jgi:hypothetical protein